MAWFDDWWRDKMNQGVDFVAKFPTNFAGVRSSEGEKPCSLESRLGWDLLSPRELELSCGSAGRSTKLESKTGRTAEATFEPVTEARRPEMVCRPVDGSRYPAQIMDVQPRQTASVYDARIGVPLEVSSGAADYRAYMSGAAGRKPPVMTGEPDQDSLELAWFACEASDEEWEAYCRAQDESLKFYGFIAKPAGGYFYSVPRRAIWPVIACDGAMMNVGIMAGERK